MKLLKKKKRKDYISIKAFNIRKALEEQIRDKSMRKQMEKNQERQNDLMLIRNEVEKCQNEYQKELIKKRSRQEYFRDCIKSSLEQQAKIIEMRKADYYKEHNEEYKNITHKNRSKSKGVLDSKMRIADTLKAVYKQEEYEKQTKLRNDPYDLYNDNSSQPIFPSRNRSLSENKNEEYHDRINEDSPVRLYGTNVNVGQRAINAYKHRTKRTYGQFDINPFQHDSNPNLRFAGLKTKRLPTYDIIAGREINMDNQEMQ